MKKGSIDVQTRRFSSALWNLSLVVRCQHGIWITSFKAQPPCFDQLVVTVLFCRCVWLRHFLGRQARTSGFRLALSGRIFSDSIRRDSRDTALENRFTIFGSRGSCHSHDR